MSVVIRRFEKSAPVGGFSIFAYVRMRVAK
jgi:hypothetical protein